MFAPVPEAAMPRRAVDEQSPSRWRATWSRPPPGTNRPEVRRTEIYLPWQLLTDGLTQIT